MKEISARGRLTRAAWLSLAIGIAGIILTLTVEVLTETDIRLQDHFFDFRTGEWLIDRGASVPRFFFYTAPKLILYPLGVLLLAAVFNARVRGWLGLEKQVCLYLLCCLAGIPLVAGTGKNITQVHCPSELRRYGGPEEYAKVISFNRPPYKKIPPHCFPAGHASGGFALFALYFWRRRVRWLIPGLVCGWTMGLYQMFKGSHFISHTLTTMFLALVLSAALSAILPKKDA
jgi:membrane-associated PAP2 superfamily phosphatase